jgi:DoxX-like family
MFTAYVIVTVLAAAANAYAATQDFSRSEWIVDNMTRLGVPQSQLFTLGALKVAGALGLLAGIAVPAIGLAAAVGLVLFFVGAIATAIHAHWYAHLSYPAAFLVLASAALVLRIAAL